MTERRYRDKTMKRLLAGLSGALLLSLVIFFASAGYITRDKPDGGGQLENAVEATNQTPEAKGMLENAADGAAEGMVQEADSAQGNAQGIAAAEPAAGTVVQEVARIATPSVVGITVEKITPSSIPSIFGRRTESQFGVGSGVIVSPDGYILTNHHVAGGRNNRIIVSLSDGRNVDGETVWSDSVLDLAVVKINQKGLPTVKLGDATKLSVGEPAIAIGNPLGLDFQRTVTLGIISAVNRTIRIETEKGINYMEDLIQTDASINPGNSGGPLLNSKAEVVGINTIKVASAEGMGFAIPIDVAKPVVEKLVNTGTFTEAYFGLFAYDKSLLPYLQTDIEDIKEGIYVAHIDENGPAYKAGLRLGCIIREIDGIKVNTMLQLRTIIFSKNPGDTIMVTHLMHGENEWVTVPVTLAEKTKDGNITR
jgi:serine protease Do